MPARRPAHRQGAHRQETYRREAHRTPAGRARAVEREAVTPIYAQPRLLEEPVPGDAVDAADLPDLHFFASFRSPYTWISTERVIRLAEAFGVDLRIPLRPADGHARPAGEAVEARLHPARRGARGAAERGSVRPDFRPGGQAGRAGLLAAAVGDRPGKGNRVLPVVHDAGVLAGCRCGVGPGIAADRRGGGVDWSEGRGYLDDPAWRRRRSGTREELFRSRALGCAVVSGRVGGYLGAGSVVGVLEDEYRRLAARQDVALAARVF